MLTFEEDFLRVMYEVRNNEGGIITPKFKEKLKTVNEIKEKKYQEFIKILTEQIKEEETIKLIKGYIGEIRNIWLEEMSIYQEQHYNIGVQDGVKMLIQCLYND